jgi:hypothetical protein
MQPFIDNKVAALPKPLADEFKADIAKAAAPKLPRVSDALTLPKSGFAKTSASKALAQIDAVHTVENLPTIPLKGSSSVKFQGRYTYKAFSGDPIDIAISSASVNPELTVAHEVGHFLDHHAFGTAGTYSSINDPLFDAWRKAIDNSQATRDLSDLLNAATDGWTAKRVSYYLARWEQWARAYAQWVATKSGNAAMLDQVGAIVASTGSKAYAASQWSAADFEPIANAIDDIFRAKGWLK